MGSICDQCYMNNDARSPAHGSRYFKGDFREIAREVKALASAITNVNVAKWYADLLRSEKVLRSLSKQHGGLPPVLSIHANSTQTDYFGKPKVDPPPVF